MHFSPRSWRCHPLMNLWWRSAASPSEHLPLYSDSLQQRAEGASQEISKPLENLYPYHSTHYEVIWRRYRTKVFH